ncbi:unnamed protein product [Ambrosiozyma monospora]|uniref:Unnamed protein product n=1 Tax=Ambrosiozyma monospora TaxID=43982 RepID=A0ACB5T1L5_AMBMO|nr:unnamed protein product [Ambrosiozyma monospora]
MTFDYNSITLDLRQVGTLYKEFKFQYPKKTISNIHQFDKSVSNVQNLSNLSVQLLDDRSTSCIYYIYKPLIIELVTRLINNDNLEEHYLSINDLPNKVPGSTVLNAIAKINSITPDISILVEYFLDQKNFFVSLKNCITTIGQNELQLTLLAFYRLITTDRQRFHRFIDPEVLHSILAAQETTNINKYLAIQILASYLFLAEKVKLDMIKKNINSDELNGYYEGDHDVNYSFLAILEAKRLSNLSKLPTSEPTTTPSATNSKNIVTFPQSDLSRGVGCVAGILVPNLTALRSSTSQPPIANSGFVPIKKSLDTLRQVSLAVQESAPIMLVGKAGTGKTFIINELANFLHMDSNDIIKIHLNQQTDSKLLLGTYTSGSKPGSFEWKNGVLTTAVKEGRWVLVEDIDKAPNEVLSILLSLLENRELTLPSRGEVIKAANGFQLISTIRVAADVQKHQIPDMIGLRLWNTIELEELESGELKTILDKKFPLLIRFSKLFINCFLQVMKIYNSRKFVSMNKGAQVRPISIRDLMKFCNRSVQILKNANIQSPDDMIEDEVFDSIFQEAVDCFTSSIVELAPIEAIVKEIGESLEIPTSRINLHLTKHVPGFEDMGESIKVGRAHLQKHLISGLKQKRTVAPGNTTSFARTNHSLRLMEKVGVGIFMNEPLLLVGETGTGW